MNHHKHFNEDCFVESFYGKHFLKKPCSPFFSKAPNWTNPVNDTIEFFHKCPTKIRNHIQKCRCLLTHRLLRKEDLLIREKKKKQMKKLINLDNKCILKELTLTFLGLCWNEETASPTWTVAVKKQGWWDEKHLDTGMIASVWTCGIQEETAVENRF